MYALSGIQIYEYYIMILTKIIMGMNERNIKSLDKIRINVCEHFIRSLKSIRQKLPISMDALSDFPHEIWNSSKNQNIQHEQSNFS